MKSTGIVRKVDELGRVVIPIELRRILDIDVKDPVEIFVEELYHCVIEALKNKHLFIRVTFIKCYNNT